MAEFFGNPGPVDRRVGQRIRARREALGLTLETLAARLGCPPSLVADYESGEARAGATTLMLLTRLLAADIGYFLGGLVETPLTAAEAEAIARNTPPSANRP